MRYKDFYSDVHYDKKYCIVIEGPEVDFFSNTDIIEEDIISVEGDRLAPASVGVLANDIKQFRNKSFNVDDNEELMEENTLSNANDTSI